jgi:hypothetical protein
MKDKKTDKKAAKMEEISRKAARQRVWLRWE